MSKNKSALLATALALTTANISKSRGRSRSNTYLDRFVGLLLDEDGKPVEPRTKLDIINEMSLDICLETRAKQIENGEDVVEFSLENEQDIEMFKKTNVKVKNQVNAAVANNKNSTSLSYNDKYKDVWAVVKGEGGLLSLKEKTASTEDEGSESEQED